MKRWVHAVSFVGDMIDSTVVPILKFRCKFSVAVDLKCKISFGFRCVYCPASPPAVSCVTNRIAPADAVHQTRNVLTSASRRRRPQETGDKARVSREDRLQDSSYRDLLLIETDGDPDLTNESTV